MLNINQNGNNVKQSNAADVKHRSMENVKYQESEMLNKIVKQHEDHDVKQSDRMVYLGVRIPAELLDEIDAMPGEGRSSKIRELLQFAIAKM
jgi:hypothetical protein